MKKFAAIVALAAALTLITAPSAQAAPPSAVTEYQSASLHASYDTQADTLTLSSVTGEAEVAYVQPAGQHATQYTVPAGEPLVLTGITGSVTITDDSGYFVLHERVTKGNGKNR